ELRTPLNSILGFSEVLLSSNVLNEKQQRWVSNIQTSGERLLALINDILDLAKIEAGKMQVRLSDFSSYDICVGMLSMFRPLAEKKNIDLRGQLDPAIPLLHQDVGKFQQILSNLLSNAIKFTPEGGRVLLRIQLVPTGLAEEGRKMDLPGDHGFPGTLLPANDAMPFVGNRSGQVLLTVSDTGVGIAPEEQGLVFEKFRQAGNPLT